MKLYDSSIQRPSDMSLNFNYRQHPIKMDAFGLELKYGMHIDDFCCLGVNVIYHNAT